MKTSNSFALLLVAFIILSISCQKNIDANKEISAQASNTETGNITRNNCFVTHTEDDLFLQAIDFIYNKKGNPDSLNLDGTPVKFHYDKWGRLLKTSFGDYAWFDFEYRKFSPLPIAFYYYFPSFGGLQTIDSFQYNFKGEIVSRSQTSPMSPDYNFIEHYTYNLFGNIIKVDIEAHNGGTIFNPGYTEFVATKYDNRPNFMTGSIWTKYAMFYSSYEGGPFLWILFSRNNAADYKWIYDSAGDSYSETSTFQYNNEGFANVVNMDWFDNVAGIDLSLFTRTSTSICDDIPFNFHKMLSAKSASIKEKISKNKFGLPSVIR